LVFFQSIWYFFSQFGIYSQYLVFILKIWYSIN
jgi:hypothetical protein